MQHVVPSEVVPIHNLAEPVLHHRGVDVVVVRPTLVAGVVRRVDVDALDLSVVRRQEGFQRREVVAFNDQIVVQAGPVADALGPDGNPLVIRHAEMVVLDEDAAFEL